MDSLLVETTSGAAPSRQSERSHRLKIFVNQLDKYNKAILLLYLDDYSYEEIVNIVGITKSNVAVKINKIKQQLKNKYEIQKTI